MKIDVSHNFDSIMTSIRRQVEEKWKELGQIAEEAGEFGSKTAQSYTLTRPGAKTGKAGRVDTGAMVEALRWKPVSFSADLIEVQYGFVDEYEAYMGMQTITGFRHNRSGEAIQPTFALRDSIGPTREFARNAARRI